MADVIKEINLAECEEIPDVTITFEFLDDGYLQVVSVEEKEKE